MSLDFWMARIAHWRICPFLFHRSNANILLDWRHTARPTFVRVIYVPHNSTSDRARKYSFDLLSSVERKTLDPGWIARIWHFPEAVLPQCENSDRRLLALVCCSFCRWNDAHSARHIAKFADNPDRLVEGFLPKNLLTYHYWKANFRIAFGGFGTPCSNCL